jgi:hypothetical protein
LSRKTCQGKHVKENLSRKTCSSVRRGKRVILLKLRNSVCTAMLLLNQQINQ